MFIGQMIEFLISMRRIEEFIKLPEMNSTTIIEVEKETTPESIEIWSGNFHWGNKLRSDDKEGAKQVSEVLDAESERVV